jgi:hypothetical protein
MARIVIEVPDSAVAGKCNRDLQYLFADALGEFSTLRGPSAEAYVARRYPDTSDYAWLNREKKIAQVRERVRLAEILHDAALQLNIEPGGER